MNTRLLIPDRFNSDLDDEINRIKCTSAKYGSDLILDRHQQRTQQCWKVGNDSGY